MMGWLFTQPSSNTFWHPKDPDPFEDICFTNRLRFLKERKIPNKLDGEKDRIHGFGSKRKRTRFRNTIPVRPWRTDRQSRSLSGLGGWRICSCVFGRFFFFAGDVATQQGTWCARPQAVCYRLHCGRNFIMFLSWPQMWPLVRLLTGRNRCAPKLFFYCTNAEA